MKLTKQRLKEIIKEEISQTMKEIDSPQNQSEKMLGDIHVRLDPLLKRWRPLRKTAQNPELQEFLHDLMDEVKLYHYSTFKYKDLGEKR
jgi:hypothetical protein